MKRLLRLLILFTVPYSFIFSQEIKDFIHPQGNINKLTYYHPSKSGGRLPVSYITWFSEYKDGGFFMTETTFMKNKPSMIVTSQIQCEGNRALLKQTVSTTMFETNIRRDYDPPKIFLVLPNENKQAKWSESDNAGDTWQYTAELIQIDIEGKPTPVIKVTQKHAEYPVTAFEYFAKGIGLWKEKLSEDLITKVLDSREFDPEAFIFPYDQD